jgi:hypothetical protein
MMVFVGFEEAFGRFTPCLLASIEAEQRRKPAKSREQKMKVEEARRKTVREKGRFVSEREKSQECIGSRSS